MSVSNAFKHLHTVGCHRREVRRLCFKIGIYWQGLTHDLSKYSPPEFLPSCKYYQGTRSPNDIQRRTEGYSSAWLHHKGRNRHHFEYWTDYRNSPDHKAIGIGAVPMPMKYVAEMFCDRIAACKTYHGASYSEADPYDYHTRTKSKDFMHPDTNVILTAMLLKLKEEGEDAACAYVKEQLKNEKSGR